MDLKLTFWRIFRFIFVIFSLYLVGDAFSRWDGFRHYASFLEFLPSVGLASIIWSILALIVSIVLWFILSSLKWLFDQIRFKIGIAHLLLCIGSFIILGALIWKVKKLLLQDVQTTSLTKLTVLISVFIISILLTWLFRNKAERWLAIVNERITPLVWLFGMFVFISIPIVSYNTLFKGKDKVVSQEITRSSLPVQKSPNIILVTFDALAAKDMSTYGYHRPTAPFITKWAKEATLLTNMEAASNWTTSTTASLMTGKRLWTHRAALLEGKPPLKSSIESLPLLLKKNGYYNMAFVANRHAGVDVLGVADSFDIAPPVTEFITPQVLFGENGIVEVFLYRSFANKIKLYNWVAQEDFILSKLESIYYHYISKNTITPAIAPPSKVFNRFLETLNNNPSEPFFAWIHLFPPHDPFLPPDLYRGLFHASSEFRDIESQKTIRLETKEYLYNFEPFPEEMQPSIAILRSIYDEYVRFCDSEFEEFIRQLTIRDRLKNTIIILSADHGESFENGYFLHIGPFLYESVTHIPLIIKELNQNEGQTIHERLEQVDIPATILDLAGISVPSWMEGRSLKPLLRGKELPPKLVFSMYLGSISTMDYTIEKGSFAVWEGDYKLIHYLEKDESLLFNLKQDPDELNNLFNKEPEIGRRLLDLINENLNRANKRIN